MTRIVLFLSLTVLTLTTLCGNAAATQLDEGYRQMYNLQFDAAHRSFQQWTADHPADPLGPVSDAAAYLFGEFDRLHILQSEFFVTADSLKDYHKPEPDPALKQKFEAALGRSQELSGKLFARRTDDPDAMFAETMRLGLHADYLALIEKKNISSLGEIKQGRTIAERLLAKNPGYYDAYIAIGLENYLLSLKPAAVRFFLRIGGAQTDRDTGIDKLKLTAEKGHYLLPYARLLLAVADLREKRIPEAKKRLTWLVNEFPGNHLYRTELAKLH